MHIEGEAILAVCYLKKEGDADNACYLSQHQLFIRYKKKLTGFVLSSIQGITFDHKLILLPLVVGGIVAPLSLHALLNNFFNPWILLSTMFLGFLLMYYGWEGTSTLTVKTNIKDYDFFISHASSNLKEFANYVKQYIADHSILSTFYLILDKKTWKTAKSRSILPIKDHIRLYNKLEIHSLILQQDQILLKIDPRENNINIIFKDIDNHKQLFPVIIQDIPSKYIQEV